MPSPARVPRTSEAEVPPSPAVASLRGPSRVVVWLRRARPLHRWVGVPLTLLVLISSLTGILLGWKKQFAVLQPPLRTGASLEARDWQPLHLISSAAEAGLRDHLGAPPGPIDRLDVRPSKGVAKVLFREGFWEVQVDLTTARVLSVDRRASDFIEALHDGSILQGEGSRVTWSTVLGLGLLVLSLSGLWLWWGPRLTRRSASSSRGS
ncbi:PepSY-associated TM helix domain-containing protein [Archangium lipolyticum]|uniref:PepSY-associated TM helix domain-containing protein n=1 Tax=Archangium lipolyticum TaxID=2970465 RepID=UPI002149F179|nr:PepSY-associated TM helix domain-containing protein [Archangium lipolyticum]